MSCEQVQASPLDRYMCRIAQRHSGRIDARSSGLKSVDPRRTEDTTQAARNLRSRRLLLTTNTELNAIAAPASIGFSRPAAASGSAATL
jgi:hypothetical protein